MCLVYFFFRGIVLVSETKIFFSESLIFALSNEV